MCLFLRLFYRLTVSIATTGMAISYVLSWWKHERRALEKN